MCQPVLQAALAKHRPCREGLADGSAVVYVFCVLEYVPDLQAALAELQRIAGSPSNIFVVTVQPWTLTSVLYPGARWTGLASGHVVVMEPVSTARKTVVGGSLAALTLLALLPRRRPAEDT